MNGYALRSCSNKQEFRRSDIDFINKSGQTSLRGSFNDNKAAQYTYSFNLPSIHGALMIDEDLPGVILVEKRPNGHKVVTEI